MSNITTKQVVEKVREIANREPDYIYRKGEKYVCSNLPDPLNPHGCIIGYAMTELGFKIQRDAAYEPAGDLIPIYLGIEDEPTEEQARHIQWCTFVQRSQDRETPWGQAVELADSNAGLA